MQRNADNTCGSLLRSSSNVVSIPTHSVSDEQGISGKVALIAGNEMKDIKMKIKHTRSIIEGYFEKKNN